MKKSVILESTYTEVYRKLELLLSKQIKELVDDNSTYGSIRIVSDGYPVVFIRLLETNDYKSNESMYYVNAYIHDSNNGRKNSLVFSEPYSDNYFKIALSKLISEILNIFEIKEYGEFKVTVIVATKLYSSIELERSWPECISDLKLFIKVLKNRLSLLNEHLPSFMLIFHVSVGGLEIPRDASIFDQGVFYISFSYQSQLSDKCSIPLYQLTGRIPSIFGDNGIGSISDIITIDIMDDVLPEYLKWYFSLKSVLVGNEHLECYIEEIPYFQQII